MSIGSIDFLTLTHTTYADGPGFKLEFEVDNEDEIYTRKLSITQLQGLHTHIENLLKAVNAMPAGKVAAPVVKTFGVKGKAAPPAPSADEDDDDDAGVMDDGEDDLDVESRPKPTTKPTTPNRNLAYRSGTVMAYHIGCFADRVANNQRRDPRRIATRVLEEVVELVLASGATTQSVWSAVADSIHNQALKASTTGRTVFPSQLVEVYDRRSILKEIADVRLVLLDLQHVTNLTTTSVESEMGRKLRNLQTHRVEDYATDGHTFYLKKPHVNAPATSI